MYKSPKIYSLIGAALLGLIFVPIYFVNENTQFLLLPMIALWYILGFDYLASSVKNILESQPLLKSHHAFLGLTMIVGIYILAGAIIGWLYGEFTLWKDRHSKY